MKKIIFLLFILSFNAIAQVGSALLLKDNKETIDLTSRLVKQKTLNLDNAYKVQLFGSWKAARIFDENINQWVELVLNDEYKKALLNYPLIYKKADVKFKKIMSSTLAYMQWQLGHNHSFLNLWINLATNSNFLQTELGLALDHIVGKSATKWILKNGIVLTPEQKKSLAKIETETSLMNYALQAWKYQRQGEKSLKWVNKLEDKDPLRIQLIYTAITDYANKGKLALSGQLIKNAIEPYIDTTNNENEVSYYYLTLGRLLYQARAFEASSFYYSLIPQSSNHFLQARVEMSWAYIQNNEIAKAKAELASLNLNMFDHKFIPDVFLTNAIVHLKTCQFKLVQNDLNNFVKINKSWAKKIEKNLKSENPKMLNWNFYTLAINKHSKGLLREGEKLAIIFNKEMIKDNPVLLEFYDNNSNVLKMSKVNLEKYSRVEKLNQWHNRKVMLEDAIYRMKFVRIEFLSQMRNLALNIPLSNTDKVSTYNAAPARRNEIRFPNDGNLWGDDLFNMSAAVKNLCLKGHKNE